MNVSHEKLKGLYTYDPPKTEGRIAKHEAVDEAAIAFAETICGQISNPAEITTILREIQKVRMLVNAAVRFEDAQLSYRALFL